MTMPINPFKITVAAHLRTLEFTNGRLSRVLEPGRYRRRAHAEYRPIDVRDQLYAIALQEIPTVDGVQVKVSAQIRTYVADPVAYDQVAVAPMELVHFSVQRALRDAVSQLEASEVLAAARGDLGRTLTEAAARAGVEVGIGIRSVEVKDVLLPAELRNAVLEAMVVQRQGQAKLEAAPVPRPRPCGQWPTLRSCSMITRPWRACAWSRRRRTAPRSSSASSAIPLPRIDPRRTVMRRSSVGAAHQPCAT